MITIVTVSGKTTYLPVLRDGGFKYLECCSLPMVVLNFHVFPMQ